MASQNDPIPDIAFSSLMSRHPLELGISFTLSSSKIEYGYVDVDAYAFVVVGGAFSSLSFPHIEPI